jgi:hypothetical protein
MTSFAGYVVLKQSEHPIWYAINATITWHTVQKRYIVAGVAAKI